MKGGNGVIIQASHGCKPVGMSKANEVTLKTSFTVQKQESLYEKRELSLAYKSESFALALRNVTLSSYQDGLLN